MRIIQGLILLMFIVQGCAVKQEYFTGNMSKNMLATNEYPWFGTEYNSYTPDPKISEEIQKNVDGVSAVIFMGTWCGDTQRELPRFYKIMDTTKVPFEVTALDRSKKSPEKTEELYNIEKIPTFIFFKNKKELGRIVESPQGTLEENILRILKNN